ncbi:ABC transporter ATP-binding protein [Eubacterium sp.]
MLEIKGLTKKYKDKLALDNFTYTFEKGVYGLLGPNGAGKSTLMNILVDGIKKSSGDIRYNGENITKLGYKYRDIIGYVPQQQGMYDSFTAEEFLNYIANLKGINKKEISDKVTEMLEFVNLENVRKKKLGGFSGGMKQRILIAQALINDPDILILDEPTAGLDPNERIRIRNLIAQISINKIVIIATHIVSDIEFIANKIIMLSAGKIIKNGSPSELLSEIDGYVFEEMIEKCNVEMYNQKYLVSGLMAGAQQVKIRYICNEKACNGHKVEPNLEDYYLYNTIK